MNTRPAPQLDMTLDGQFRDPPGKPLAARIVRTAIAVAVVAGFVAILGLMLWAALMMIPIAIGAALVAWGAYRFQLWRARRAGFVAASPPAYRR